MTSSDISRQLVDNYRNTIYRINTAPESIDLRIDAFSEPLAALLRATNPRSSAIISAYNPFSRKLSGAQNLQAHELLRLLLRSRAYFIVEGQNIDLSGQWPDEKSFFVCGIDLNAAQSIARQFNQNAIVWIDTDAIPRLQLLR